MAQRRLTLEVTEEEREGKDLRGSRRDVNSLPLPDSSPFLRPRREAVGRLGAEVRSAMQMRSGRVGKIFLGAGRVPSCLKKVLNLAKVRFLVDFFLGEGLAV